MKAKRQQEILSIIAKADIETQEQLLAELEASGIKATQATISRDIKDLHLVKEQTAGGSYRYTQASGSGGRNFGGRLRNIFREGVTSFDIAQNIVVIKTMPGLASAAAATLDGMELDGFVGSLAGDDTAILIMRTNESAEALYNEIHQLLH